ncbi:hypothetical protein AVEN_177162-1 [Araneus ventricosus]|uniref:Uncharacterized protein n=1 Tax=Araneus ventricosus TaxID=182803 RepID=A0A4Y2RTR6_ARAVE|nr:hypothetical protein AVEN_177162-1 [Araneus ventricosus]
MLEGSRQHEDYFGTDLVSLNHGQMTRISPELAHHSPSFRTTSGEGRRQISYAPGPHTGRIFSGIEVRSACFVGSGSRP